ncbi:MAG: MerR family transcriptional regulator [Thermincola sp.]|jgi:DNA-binding transcriptional MerR regulator|nr:MerR family transcriptional regulator [Thermincola sp.]
MEEYLALNQVSEILQVEQSTIRFWEKEFADFLKIKTKRGQHKRFSPEHLEVLNQIKELLYSDMYTIKGARRRLEMDRTLNCALGIESNFKTTVLFMFSAIMKELQNYKEETRELRAEVRKLREQKNKIEDLLLEEKNKGLIDFLKGKMQLKKVSSQEEA